MRDLVILFIHLIVTLARLHGPGGMRSVVAESALVKHQLLILDRTRARSPNPRTSDRLVAGLCALCIHPARLIRSAIVLKPSTLLSLHLVLQRLPDLHADPFDRMLVCQAIVHGMVLLTPDAQIQAYPVNSRW